MRAAGIGGKGKMINLERKELSGTERKTMQVFLMYSFVIAWGSEAAMIVLYRLTCWMKN